MFWSVRHNHRSFPLAVWQCVLQRASSAKSKRQPDARSVSVTQEDLKPDWPDSYGKRPLCFYRVMPEERVGVSAFAVRRSPFAVHADTPLRRHADTLLLPGHSPSSPGHFCLPWQKRLPVRNSADLPLSKQDRNVLHTPDAKTSGHGGMRKASWVNRQTASA
jgi:hypothetical protein